MKKLSNTIIGNMGEHYVLAELNKQGFVTAVTGRNEKDIDILCVNTDNHKMSSIQVKTTKTIKNGKGSWILGKRNENCYPNHYYVFVSLGSNEIEYFVIPSDKVSKYIKESHLEWLRTPGKNGKAHKDNNIRNVFYSFAKNYKNNWDCLK